ncbi:MAG: hypothetical protein V2J62_04805 [candidate division KSB1 bacterium]|nr:hypothetical protein [candidate division KSB1 bacterium]
MTQIMRIRFISHRIDISPRKHGKYISGTCQKILRPDAIREIQPDVIVLMNQLYKNEIRRIVEEYSMDVDYLYP